MCCVFGIMLFVLFCVVLCCSREDRVGVCGGVAEKEDVKKSGRR